MNKFKEAIKNASVLSTHTSCVFFLNGTMILHTVLTLVLLI